MRMRAQFTGGLATYSFLGFSIMTNSSALVAWTADGTIVNVVLPVDNDNIQIGAVAAEAYTPLVRSPAVFHLLRPLGPCLCATLRSLNPLAC